MTLPVGPTSDAPSRLNHPMFAPMSTNVPPGQHISQCGGNVWLVAARPRHGMAHRVIGWVHMDAEPLTGAHGLARSLAGRTFGLLADELDTTEELPDQVVQADLARSEALAVVGQAVRVGVTPEEQPVAGRRHRPWWRCELLSP